MASNRPYHRERDDERDGMDAMMATLLATQLITWLTTPADPQIHRIGCHEITGSDHPGWPHLKRPQIGYLLWPLYWTPFDRV